MHTSILKQLNKYNLNLMSSSNTNTGNNKENQEKSVNIFGFNKECDSDQEENSLNAKTCGLSENSKEELIDTEDDVSSLGGCIAKIEVYEKMKFEKLEIRRSAKKNKTEIWDKSAMKKVKINEDITKYTEEFKFESKDSDFILYDEINKHYIKKERNTPDITRKGDKKRKTIKFSTQKVTYQYPKQKEGNFNFYESNDEKSDYEGSVKEEAAVDEEEDGNGNEIAKKKTRTVKMGSKVELVEKVKEVKDSSANNNEGEEEGESANN